MMKNLAFVSACLLLLFCACQKESVVENPATTELPPATPSFKKYLIPAGEHYATENPFKPLETAELRFTVRFDSSAVYQTAAPQNQDDINKLYGFADNGAHHQQFSARFGWRWSNGALRLFGYTYNNGIRDAKELGVVPIGKDVQCSIKVAGEIYVFTLNDVAFTMPRSSSGEKAKGYQLYPYFGGDEAAPHDVRIWIGEE